MKAPGGVATERAARGAAYGQEVSVAEFPSVLEGVHVGKLASGSFRWTLLSWVRRGRGVQT